MKLKITVNDSAFIETHTDASIAGLSEAVGLLHYPYHDKIAVEVVEFSHDRGSVIIRSKYSQSLHFYMDFVNNIHK